MPFCQINILILNKYVDVEEKKTKRHLPEKKARLQKAPTVSNAEEQLMECAFTRCAVLYTPYGQRGMQN